MPLEKYVYNEGRYTMLVRSAPETAAAAAHRSAEGRRPRWKLYEHWASMPYSNGPNGGSKHDRPLDRYLGLKLRSPLVASSSPLAKDLANLQAPGRRRAPRPSCFTRLFEEQIVAEQEASTSLLSQGADSYRGSPKLLSGARRLRDGPRSLPGAHPRSQEGTCRFQ